VILAAGLLVLVGLGLFVAGLATGTTLLYWATVVVCALAAVLLVLSRRGVAGSAPAEVAAAPRRSATTRGAPVSRAAAPESDEPAADTGKPEPDPAPDSEPDPVPDAPAEPPAAPAAQVPAAAVGGGEPPVEEVEVTDLLLVVDLKEDVFVLDEHPRYHLAECPRLVGHEAIPLPLDEARTDGFTPCGVCSPDRTLAERERARRAGRGA
jgi:hypothetical protein